MKLLYGIYCSHVALKVKLFKVNFVKSCNLDILTYRQTLADNWYKSHSYSLLEVERSGTS